MRAIIFRGKEKTTGMWVHGSYTALQEDDKNNPFARNIPKTYHRIWQWEAGDWNLGGYANYEVNPDTIGQFIGLKDINGEKIYEGDIVDWVFFRYYGTEEEHHLRGIIEWYQGGFIYKVIKNNFENCGYYGISSLNTDTESECEIVGNIYDNPELLKK